MSQKPVLLMSHLRALSTAVERVSSVFHPPTVVPFSSQVGLTRPYDMVNDPDKKVFMTCQDTLTCLHEPFGDAFYWGPERGSPRSETERNAQEGAGYEDCTYAAVLQRIFEAAEVASPLIAHHCKNLTISSIATTSLYQRLRLSHLASTRPGSIFRSFPPVLDRLSNGTQQPHRFTNSHNSKISIRFPHPPSPAQRP